MADHILTIRPVTAIDAAAVARLAELEEAQPLTGDGLLAELDGAVVAAVSMADGRAIADIFKPTADIVQMLRDHRERIIRASAPRPVERRRGIRGLFVPRRAAAAA